MHHAVLDLSDVTTKDVVFAVEAINRQLREHWAPAYEVEPPVVAVYRSVTELPAGALCVVVITDSVPPGELGDHDALRTARVLFRSNPNWVQTFSHEILEMAGNLDCNLWLPHPSRPGFKLAREMCDPCQAGQYPVTVEILGESRTLMVSDFCMPGYWVHGAPPPYNYLDTMEAPGEVLPGGYQIVRTLDGSIDYLNAFGESVPPGPRGQRVMASVVD